MKIDLSGKVAIVTGSTGGIGLAIARGLAGCGATVILNGPEQGAVDRALAALWVAVPMAEIRGVVADLSVAAGCDALVKTEPTCDILVNNVGIFGPHDFFDMPDSEWTRFFELNCDVRRPAVARLYPCDVGAQLGTRRVPVIGIGAEHSTRHDPLWLHEDGSTGNRAGPCQAFSRNPGHGEFGAPGADADGRCRRYAEGEGGEHWPVDRRGCTGIRQGQQAVFHHRPDGHAQRGGQYGRLRRRPAGLGNNRRRAAGRWRHCRYDRLILLGRVALEETKMSAKKILFLVGDFAED